MSNMQGMQLNTDFTNVQPNLPGGGSFPVTTDKLGHLVHIVESGPRENRNKNGMMLHLKLEGLDGVVKGQSADHFINVANPNQEAVRIGYSEISAIAHVVGVLRVGNSADLHRKPFRVLVRKQKDNETYTEIYGVLDVNGNEPGKAGQGPLNAGQNNWGANPNPNGGGGQQGGQQGGFQPGQQGGFQPGPGQGGNPNPGGGQGGGNWNANPPQNDPNQGGGGWNNGPANNGGGQGGQPGNNQGPGWGPGGGNQGGDAPGWARQ